MVTDPGAPHLDYLTEEHITELVRHFLASVLSVAKELKEQNETLDLKKIKISKAEIASAFAEAKNDLRFLLERRGFTNDVLQTKGLAEGKVAGILAFRLLRGRIVHYGDDNAIFDNRNVGLIQPLAVLRLVFGAVLNINLNEPPFVRKNHDQEMRPWVVTELLYLVLRRHYNQESLALIFEMAVASNTRIVIHGG